MWTSRTAVAVLLVLFAVALPLFGGEPPVPIEGLLYVYGSEADWTPFGWLIAGQSDQVTPIGFYQYGNISPLEDRICYEICDDYDSARNVPRSLTVWVADLDGSNATNLTEQLGLSGAGLHGVNCHPEWSPDGTMIAFFRCEAVPGTLPCSQGFHVWVARADGSEAWRVTDEGALPTNHPTWSPNGYRLVCTMEGLGAITIDTDGSDMTVLPNVGYKPRFSPDGSKIVSLSGERGELDGEPGGWNRVVLTDRDGLDPVMPPELSQFIKDADVNPHLQRYGYSTAPGSIWPGMLRAILGPDWAHWSPRGDRIVFSASAAGTGTSVLGWDPDGPDFHMQGELWVYALPSEVYPGGDLTRITDDDASGGYLCWNGHNTFPEDPEVVVDNTTVTFDDVLGEGLTTIIRDDDPPDLPTGFGFAGEYYEIHTTAEVTGPIQVEMTYLDEDIPSGTEGTLCICHWSEETQTWEDITTSRDPVNNIVYGVSDSLSLFGLAISIPEAHFLDVPATGFGPKGYHPHWAFYQIEACAEAGIVQGYPGGLYLPNLPVARDQMAVFVSRALAGGDGLVPTGPPTATFSDVLADHWAFKYVEYAVENGVVAGYGDGTYRPTETVTRDQMAVFVARAMVGGEAYVPTGPETAFFPDVATDHWAFRYVEYIRGESVTGGYPDGNYHPEYEVTRDQMAVFVQRAFALPM